MKLLKLLKKNYPVVILLVILCLFVLRKGNKGCRKKPVVSAAPSAGSLTVFGTEWCGWTTKQKEYLDDKGIEYEYVDCESSDGRTQCEALDVKGFPVMRTAEGKMLKGYNEI